MRYLPDVIDAIIEVAPDLKPKLWGRRDSCFYTPPEAMGIRWAEVTHILNECALDHPQAERIKAIFNDTEALAQDQSPTVLDAGLSGNRTKSEPKDVSE